MGVNVLAVDAMRVDFLGVDLPPQIPSFRSPGCSPCKVYNIRHDHVLITVAYVSKEINLEPKSNNSQYFSSFKACDISVLSWPILLALKISYFVLMSFV